MKLSDRTPCELFKIEVPIWDKRQVGLNTKRVGMHNEIQITARSKDGDLFYPHPMYISGEQAKTYTIKKIKNTGVEIYQIPISDLELLDRVSQEDNNKEIVRRAHEAFPN